MWGFVKIVWLYIFTTQARFHYLRLVAVHKLLPTAYDSHYQLSTDGLRVPAFVIIYNLTITQDYENFSRKIDKKRDFTRGRQPASYKIKCEKSQKQYFK